jgi:hypothetical protein
VQDETPVLLLGYNRPEQMRGLIRSLADVKPKLILLSVDGPKTNRTKDVELVGQTQEMINEITWDAEIRTRFRESNLGLRKAVVDAVTWANSEYGRVIVLEDDVRAGPQLLNFFNFNLKRFESSERVAHINGYNLVPVEYLSQPDRQSRLSIYPESFAWATWARAWEKYDDELTWAKNASIEDLKLIVGTTFGALKWKQNFSDASAELIDTWAYRWLASMWEHKLLMLSPNRNLSSYSGWSGGTHTFRKVQYKEPAIAPLASHQDLENKADYQSDRWLANNIFKENLRGYVNGAFISTVLRIVHSVKHQNKTCEA